jgi:hypothetical protein
MITISQAITMIRGGAPVELRSLFGGLGGGQGGWRLSAPASLLLIAAVQLAGAVGFANLDFPLKTSRPNSAPRAVQPGGGTKKGADAAAEGQQSAQTPVSR